jgi:hypothetical protein
VTAHTRRSVIAAAGLLGLLPLSACGRPRTDDVGEEVARRERFARNLLVVDGGPAPALRVGSSTEVHFEEGFTPVQFDPVDDAKGHAFRWMGKRGHVRVHTQGNEPMHLRIAGWMNEKGLHMRPTAMAFIDGQGVGYPVPADENGIFVIDFTVEPSLFHGKRWVDLDIVPSSVAYHWADPPELKMVVVFDFVWRREKAWTPIPTRPPEADGGTAEAEAADAGAD